MNIGSYISSGIIESYVLGLATSEERAEFEKLCTIYPELVAERNKFELMLERNALANAKKPPVYLNKQLLEMISVTPVSPPETIAIPKRSPIFSANALRWMAAACVAILLGCGYFFYRLQQQNKQLALANTQLQARYNRADSVLTSMVNARKILNSNSLSLVTMAGTAEAPKASAYVYWDSASSAVYMIVKNLQPLPPAQQYQLWALIHGSPKSLGVFDATSNKVILKMRNCKKAEAFSITVEPKGGNSQPTPNSTRITGKNI